MAGIPTVTKAEAEACEKAAEKLGYQRGYAAGRRKKAKDMRAGRFEAERRAFRRRAFLAALPACLEAANWQRDGKPIVGLADRVRLAREAADEAMKGFY